jgi:hypothetical protein
MLARRMRILATGTVTTALVMAGLAVSAGSAAAATTISCASGSGVTGGGQEYFTGTVSGCGTYTAKGAPYDFTVATFTITFFQAGPRNPVTYTEYDVSFVCQTFTPVTITAGSYAVGTCTVPA